MLSLPLPAAEPGRVVVIAHGADIASGPVLPFYPARVRAGFPSPADDYTEGEIDLRVTLGISSPSCFLVRAEGWSMRGEGIFDGDVMVVDRAIDPVTGMIVIASVDGDLTVKRFVRRGRRVALLSGNPEYPPIDLVEGQELVVWGVVTHSVRFHLPAAHGLRRAAA